MALCTLSCILLQNNTHIPQLSDTLLVIWARGLWLPRIVPTLPFQDSCLPSHPQLNSTFLFRDRLEDKFRSTLCSTQGDAEATSDKALKKWGRRFSACSINFDPHNLLSPWCGPSNKARYQNPLSSWSKFTQWSIHRHLFSDKKQTNKQIYFFYFSRLGLVVVFCLFVFYMAFEEHEVCSRRNLVPV